MSIIKLILDAIKELFRAIFAPLGNLFQSLFGGVWQTLASVFKFRPDEVKRPLLVLVSIIIIVSSLVSIFLSMRTPTPRINVKPFVGLGEVTARETIKLVGDHGEVIVLTYAMGEVKSPVFDAQLDAFRSVLAKESHLKVRAIEEITMEPMMMDPMGGLSGEKYLEVVRKYPGINAIVSFLGTPNLTPQELKQLPSTDRPKFVAAMGYSPMLGDLMKQDVVQVAITPRFQPPDATEKEPETAQEWFDRFYTVVTPGTTDQLPDFLGGS